MLKQKQSETKTRNQVIVITLLLNCIPILQITFHHLTQIQNSKYIFSNIQIMYQDSIYKANTQTWGKK